MFDKDFEILSNLDKKYNFLQKKFAIPEQPEESKSRSLSPKNTYYRKMEDLGKYDFQYIENFRNMDSEDTHIQRRPRRRTPNNFPKQQRQYSPENHDEDPGIQQEVQDLREGADAIRQMLKNKIRDL
jgi:hypothetical protein